MVFLKECVPRSSTGAIGSQSGTYTNLENGLLDLSGALSLGVYLMMALLASTCCELIGVNFASPSQGRDLNPLRYADAPNLPTLTCALIANPWLHVKEG